MTTIDPGTNGTIKSSTLEGQLQEVCLRLQLAESSSASNPTSIDNFTLLHSPESKSFTATFSIPVQQTINASGQVVYSASEYLTGINFTNGGGTFKSTTLAGYFVEIAIYAQILERQTAKNPTGRNGITGTFNSDNTLFSGAIDLPVSVTVESDGSIKYIADEYLLN